MQKAWSDLVPRIYLFYHWSWVFDLFGNERGVSIFGTDKLCTNADSLIGTSHCFSIDCLWCGRQTPLFDHSRLIQYLAPISQLLIGVMIYNEPFSSAHKVTFSLIWIALGIYTFEALFYKHVQTGKIRTEKKKAVL